MPYYVNTVTVECMQMNDVLRGLLTDGLTGEILYWTTTGITYDMTMTIQSYENKLRAFKGRRLVCTYVGRMV